MGKKVKVKNYKAEFKLLQKYLNLKIRKNKVNFTPKEKRLITRNINIFQKQGVIEYNSIKKSYKPRVKFIKSKKKKEKFKGTTPLNGFFMKGAKPEDKVKRNRILGHYFDKVLIPVEFSGAARFFNEDDFSQIYDFVEQRLIEALTPYLEEIKLKDYFTIVTENGWEIGRGRQKKKENKYGQPVATGRQKIKNLTRRVVELLIRSIQYYEIDDELISGLYWYNFKRQKKPSKTVQKKIAKKKKR